MPLVLLEVDHPIATLTLSRPEKLNAITTPMLEELRATQADLAGKEEARCVVLTGAGRAFSAGADIDELHATDALFIRRQIGRIHAVCEAIERLPWPVVAAVRGHCLGAGHEIVVACDLTIAADDARIGYPEIQLGIPSVVHAALTMRYASIGIVRELMYTGETIDAPEALRVGLVNRVVPGERLLEEARALAGRIAANTPTALRLQKELINQRWLRTDLESAIVSSMDLLALARTSPEARKRMAANRERLQGKRETAGDRARSAE